MDGLRLHIRPKVPLRNLFYMLTYAYELGPVPRRAPLATAMICSPSWWRFSSSRLTGWCATASPAATWPTTTTRPICAGGCGRWSTCAAAPPAPAASRRRSTSSPPTCWRTASSSSPCGSWRAAWAGRPPPAPRAVGLLRGQPRRHRSGRLPARRLHSAQRGLPHAGQPGAAVPATPVAGGARRATPFMSYLVPMPRVFELFVGRSEPPATRRVPCPPPHGPAATMPTPGR